VTARTFGSPTFQDFKGAHLRIVYQKLDYNPAPGASSISGFGLSHDGAFAGVVSFLSKPFFGGLLADQRNNLNAFLLCFDTGTAPTVGYTRTLSSTNVNLPDLVNDWTLLENQAVAGTNIDLIIKGTLDGQRRGLLFQPLANTYKPDSTNLPSLTRAQLAAKVLAGDALTIMGVPPGSGQRMAIDRDLNGVLDADEPLPGLQIALSAAKIVVSWPLGAVGFVLQEAASLDSPAWTDTPDAVSIVNGFNSIVRDPASTTRYFRLRQL